MAEIKVVRVLKKANYQSGKDGKTPVYQTVKNVLHRIVAQGAVNEVTLMKVDTLTESQDSVQHFTWNLIKNQSFTVPITYFVRQHTQASIANEATFYDQSVTRPNQDEEDAPPSPQPVMSPESPHLLLEEEKKEPKEKTSSSPFKSSKPSNSTCRKCRSNKDYSDDHNVYRHNKGGRGVRTLKSVHTHFTKALAYNSYRLVRRSWEYNGNISGNVAKSAKRMDVLMKSGVFKPSDRILIPPFLHNFKTVGD